MTMPPPILLKSHPENDHSVARIVMGFIVGLFFGFVIGWWWPR